MSDMDVPLYDILLILLLLLIQISISAFTIAVEKITDSELQKMQKKHPRIVSKINGYQTHESYYRMVFCTITGLNIVLSEILVEGYFEKSIAWLPSAEEIILWIVILLLYLFLYLFWGIVLPFLVASKKKAGAILNFYPVFRVIAGIFYPFNRLLLFFAHIFARLFGVDPSHNPDDVTEEEIISIVNEGHEQGTILAREAEMIQNILSFDDKDAKRIMIHRNEIVALDGEMTFQKAIPFVIENHFSRYPVYIKDLDNIIGVVHIREILEFMDNQSNLSQKIRDVDGLIRPAESVPETHGIHTLFTTMQHEKSHMAIVVDEYGQTVGLVTLEDILEEIVGNIEDEHDETKESIETVNKTTFLMEGRTDLSEVAEKLKITFNDDTETLNGFLIQKYDKIPAEHEKFTVTYGGYDFMVQDVHDNVIQAVCVKKHDS